MDITQEMFKTMESATENIERKRYIKQMDSYIKNRKFLKDTDISEMSAIMRTVEVRPAELRTIRHGQDKKIAMLSMLLTVALLDVKGYNLGRAMIVAKKQVASIDHDLLEMLIDKEPRAIYLALLKTVLDMNEKVADEDIEVAEKEFKEFSKKKIERDISLDKGLNKLLDKLEDLLK